ncbi:hypothetical protein ANN_09026 [Periplaneta americana]|uniref:Uncharacterized protein n=1 Tax=Periplaneta americana TaxID=6978 RepID=A0ABQ8TM04_PERAM|nr:hypothetical protein ANN_09026 [Periplaneta americana]
MKTLLPYTAAYSEQMTEIRKKQREIDLELYITDDITNRNWTKKNQEWWHIITRYVIHGYNHNVWRNETVNFSIEHMNATTQKGAPREENQLKG